jgi:hypothetical protein
MATPSSSAAAARPAGYAIRSYTHAAMGEEQQLLGGMVTALVDAAVVETNVAQQLAELTYQQERAKLHKDMQQLDVDLNTHHETVARVRFLF